MGEMKIVKKKSETKWHILLEMICRNNKDRYYITFCGLNLYVPVSTEAIGCVHSRVCIDCQEGTDE